MSPEPVDPRLAGDAAVPVSLETVEAVDELATRVLAPNASAMTLDGTNTYVVGTMGSGRVVVVDPGPDDESHLDRVRAEVARRDAEVDAVLVTHGHLDHSEAAARWARLFGCRLLSSTGLGDGEVIRDGETVALGGTDRIEVVATPGHTFDHLSFRLPSGALLTGDHVLGRGTSVITHPEGHLESYVRSLRRLLDLGPDVLLPGHGPSMTEDTEAIIAYYLAHRRHRIEQVVTALADGPASSARLVARVYPQLDASLSAAARQSVEATLELLVDHGIVRELGDPATDVHEPTFDVIGRVRLEKLLDSVF